ncbi:hypothetical protein FB45DRAFT_1030781 [Roridomyces roridus]|uniref:Zn(2)-C6 fungal-type domain-containing protein n=1 Tax=Roridomyces roridus TaxID=1738132 RepID=A0AAD7BLS0_9AGAR|nr:hypothetical protein FB45DRAFT_1030781 [Roridomyces roridus]
MYALTSQFPSDEVHIDIESEMPPLHHSPHASFQRRGSALDARIARSPINYKTWGEEHNFAAMEHHNEGVGIATGPTFAHLGDPTMPFGFVDVPPHLIGPYLDFPDSYSDSLRPHSSSSHTLSDSVASSPEPTDSTSSSSPGIPGLHPSSGPYIDLPALDLDEHNTAWQSSSTAFPHSLPYLGPTHGSDGYQSDTTPSSSNYPPYSLVPSGQSRRGNTWGYSSPSSSAPPLPTHSGHSAALSAPPPKHRLLCVPSGDLRRWPDMFDMRHMSKKYTGKKQSLACFFCRERKIGCIRPAEDEPDQTCNQCLRRKRPCAYPTESKRGQHTRERNIAKKKFLSAEIAAQRLLPAGAGRPPRTTPTMQYTDV